MQTLALFRGGGGVDPHSIEVIFFIIPHFNRKMRDYSKRTSVLLSLRQNQPPIFFCFSYFASSPETASLSL